MIDSVENQMQRSGNEEQSYLEELANRIASSWPAELPREPFYAFGKRPLTEYARGWAERQPYKPAIIFYGSKITFAELDRWSDGIAAWLQARGVGRGDRVALFMPTCPQFVIGFMGILKAGAIVVPISSMARQMEIEHFLSDSGAKVVIAQDQLLGTMLSIDERYRPKCVLATSFKDLLPPEPELPVPCGFDLDPPLAAPVNAFLEAIETPAAPPISSDWGDPAVINYTGGTTGLPKGCVHAHSDLVYTGACTATLSCPGVAQGVVLNYFPLFWIGGEVTGILTPLISGAPVVLLARWDAETMIQAIERYEVTTTWMLVDNAVEVLDSPTLPKHDLRSLRNSLVASFVKVLNPEIRARWKAAVGSVLRETSWGMTETNTLDTFTTGFQDKDFDLSRLPTFVGLPMPDTEFKVVDHQTSALLPLGQEGELCVRSPSLFKEYWRDPAATSQALRNGWLHTNDTAIIDEQGFITFRGRKREMLKVNGVSVFPSEVEALLMRHPAIEACGVVGRPDAAKGQVPVAFIALKVQGTESRESLSAWCRANMAVYKVPDIRIVDRLPLTATGKVKRNELHALL